MMFLARARWSRATIPLLLEVPIIPVYIAGTGPWTSHHSLRLEPTLHLYTLCCSGPWSADWQGFFPLTWGLLAWQGYSASDPTWSDFWSLTTHTLSVYDNRSVLGTGYPQSWWRWSGISVLDAWRRRWSIRSDIFNVWLWDDFTANYSKTIIYIIQPFILKRFL